MIVDLHSHYFPLDAVRRLLGRRVEVTEQPDGSSRVIAFGHELAIDAALPDLDRQRAELRRQGLDRRVLMVPPFAVLYELAPEDGAAWCRALNDGIATAAQSDPESFAGFATVPLQDPAAAVREAERAAGALGLLGVEILTSVSTVGIDTPMLDPFWAAVERLGLPVLMHPHYVSGAERMGDYYLRNLIGNPTETAQAGARLLFGGVLERFPGLKIVLSHGGGALPHLIGRLRHGFQVRPEARVRAAEPIVHLRRLYYDTVVFDPAVLRHVVEIAGPTQVVLGTDYPFDMAETDPVGFVRASGLPSDVIDTVLHAGDRLLPESSPAHTNLQ